MDTKILQEEVDALGEDFIDALVKQDFNRVKSIFEPQVRFRALVPARLCEGKTSGEATDWLRRWFGDADEIQVLQSAADQVFDRLYLNYRLRVHDVLNGWRVIEQQAYSTLHAGQIADLWLVCSGFRPESSAAQSQVASGGSAAASYDAGARGCAEGPLDDISELVRALEPGQSLQVHATDPSVATDLPSWCRLAGHEFIQQKEHQYLIRKKA